MRSDAFAAMGALQLAMIPDHDLNRAVNTMSLPLQQKQALLQNTQTPSIAPRASAMVRELAKRASKATLPAPAETQRLQLAWLTLWDTDIEDGDVVRIDSQGYSRTITLTKAPVTFAIPVPVDGVVKVTGIRDGDGGGITVGLASGASRAVFPIMSREQVLGLRVRVN